MTFPIKGGRVTPAATQFVLALAKLSRPDAFNLYTGKAKSKYRKIDAELSESTVAGHLSNDQPISVFPVTKDQARYAVLDFDDHDGTTQWSDMASAAKAVVEKLTEAGVKCFAVRSGGGRGIHIWLAFKSPQSARTVRRFLTRTLKDCGFTVGDRPVSDGQVQIFPKSDSQGKGGYGGGAIALPFARKSVPLDADFNPLGLESYEPPSLVSLLNVDVDESAPPSDEASPEEAPMALGEGLDEMLSHIPADDRDVWIRVGMALKATYGDEALETWDRWSAKSDAYEGSEDCETAWCGLTPTGSIGLGSLAYLAKANGYAPPGDLRLLAINERYARLTVGQTPVVIDLEPDGASHDVLTTLNERTFVRRMSAEPKLAVSEGGKPKLVNIGRYWLDWPQARHYTHVIFDPSRPPGHNGSGYNVWQGFTVDPAPGDCSLLLAHIRDNVCDGDDEAYEWVMNWLALAVQRPAEPPGTALVLKGKPGTGKGFFANMVGRLWGIHFKTVTHKQHFTGRFNFHLYGRRFIFVDEGVYGGDPREADIVKVMITEPVITWEEKFRTPFPDYNRMAFVIASNRDSAAPVMDNDRRFTVLEVSDNRVNDRAYFSRIAKQMNDGGDAGFLDLLLSRDINDGPNPRQNLRRAAAFEDYLEHAPPEIKAIHRALDEGCLPGSLKNLENTANSFEFFDQMQAFGGYGARNTALTRLGKAIRRYLPSVESKQGSVMNDSQDKSRGRPRIYTFPPLQDARAEFAINIGHVIDWQNDAAAWEAEHPC